MQRLSRVGRDTGQLTDEELRFIDSEIIGAAWPALRAREIFEIKTLPNAGLRSLRHYVETDMGQAVITMDGETISLDQSSLAYADTKIPVLSKDFVLNWRDLDAARHNGVPLDVAQGRNAARQVAEDENKLLLTGEYTGFSAVGIKGLYTSAGNTTTGGAWPANAVANIEAAIAELQTGGFTQGPYVLVGRVAQIAKLDQAIANTMGTYRTFLLQNKILDAILADDSLYSAAGATTVGMVVVPGRDNFELLVGQDITTFEYGLENMNRLFRVYEVVSPHIKRAKAICSITGLS
jgi:uncharacterized linocin/CFP29 family protein